MVSDCGEGPRLDSANGASCRCALHCLLANHHAPVGFEATRKRLLLAVGVGRSRKWTEAQLLEALALLDESRRSHLAYRSAFAARRRDEKASGRRQPTRGDLAAFDHPEWLKDTGAGQPPSAQPS